MKKLLMRFAVSTVLILMTGIANFGQHYNQTNLVSNTSGAAVTDPQLTIPGAYRAVPAAHGGSQTTRPVSVHSTTAREPGSL